MTTPDARAERAAGAAERAATAANRARTKLVGSVAIIVCVLVLIPTLVGFYFIDKSIARSNARDAVAREKVIRIDAWARYDSAIAGCRRGNAVRAHEAQLDVAIRTVARLVALFLDSSIDLRQALGEDAKAQEAADQRDALKLLAAALQDAPQVRCAEEIERPPFDRPAP